MSDRWLVVTALFVVIFAVANALAAFGVFLPVLADTFGWSRGGISVALSINLLVSGLAGVPVGAIADRYGPRFILLATIGIAAGGFALASTLSALWQLYLYIGLMGGLGGSAFYVVGTATVIRWFDRNRGLPLAIVLTGFNIAFITGGPLAAWLIQEFGWRAAYLILGGGVCVVGGAAALLVRNPPPRLLPGRPDDRPRAHTPGLRLGEALTDRRLWLFNLVWFVAGGVYLMVSVHAVAYARDRGVGLETASLALTAYGVGATIGRLASGPLSDRLGGRGLMRACIGLQILALGALPFGPSQDVVLVLLALFGMGWSGADTVLVRAIPEVFGLAAIGAITGVLAIGWRAGAALGPAAAGFVHDLTDSYALAFGAAPVALALSYVFFVAGSKPRAR